MLDPDRLAVPGVPAVDASAAQPEAFRALVRGIGVLAGFTHVAFCALFFWAKVDMLAYVNIASVLCYVAVFMLAHRGKTEQAWALTVLEVLGHAILAVTVIGWDSGFHYYILLVIPVAVISSIRPLALKIGTVLGVMATYLTLDIVLRQRDPPYLLPAGVVDGLHYFNVVGVMLILLFLAGFYYHLINEAEVSLRAMAATDPLTKLHNRRSISDIIGREHERVQRQGHPMSFVLCDLDHFKNINDTHGHEVGDLVLKAVSQAMQRHARQVDYLARWGGEEFLAVLPDTDEAAALAAAERLRAAVQALGIPVGAQSLQISMTLGVATMAAGESAEQAIARADAALYDGKRHGRNTVVMAPPAQALPTSPTP